jgi:hypothetical protein
MCVNLCLGLVFWDMQVSKYEPCSEGFISWEEDRIGFIIF